MARKGHRYQCVHTSATVTRSSLPPQPKRTHFDFVQQVKLTQQQPLRGSVVLLRL